jgi:flagellin-like hook-associated protein FlgL
MQVRHTLTTYSHGSGISPGTGSASQDTVIGALGTHSVQIIDTSGDGSSGTISLNGGTPVTFTDSDTNLIVRDANGRRIYVNTTSIVPGFNGTIQLAASGTISVDGGLTTTDIDYTDSQTLTDSTTGLYTHIDTRQINQTGDNYLEFPGTSNVFQVLFELVQDLQGSRDLNSSQYSASLDRRLEELESLSTNLLDTVGKQSASLSSLRRLGERLSDVELETKEYLIELQATDVAEAVLYMKNDQTLLEYAYAITAQLSSLRIVDFLR